MNQELQRCAWLDAVKPGEEVLYDRSSDRSVRLQLDVQELRAIACIRFSDNHTEFGSNAAKLGLQRPLPIGHQRKAELGRRSQGGRLERSGCTDDRPMSRVQPLALVDPNVYSRAGDHRSRKRNGTASDLACQRRIFPWAHHGGLPCSHIPNSCIDRYAVSVSPRFCDSSCNTHRGYPCNRSWPKLWG